MSAGVHLAAFAVPLVPLVPSIGVPVALVWSPLVTLWPPLAPLVCPPLFPSDPIWALVVSIGLSVDPRGVHRCPFGVFVTSIGALLAALTTCIGVPVFPS